MSGMSRSRSARIFGESMFLDEASDMLANDEWSLRARYLSSGGFPGKIW